MHILFLPYPLEIEIEIQVCSSKEKEKEIKSRLTTVDTEKSTYMKLSGPEKKTHQDFSVLTLFGRFQGILPCPGNYRGKGLCCKKNMHSHSSSINLKQLDQLYPLHSRNQNSCNLLNSATLLPHLLRVSASSHRKSIILKKATKFPNNISQLNIFAVQN